MVKSFFDSLDIGHKKHFTCVHSFCVPTIQSDDIIRSLDDLVPYCDLDDEEANFDYCAICKNFCDYRSKNEI